MLKFHSKHMPEKILVGVAWPYSNGSLHIGQIAGAYLPADIFARYHRAAGNDLLMVSGSDQHGTPITVRAEQEGQTPAEVAALFHDEFVDSWKRLGISWNLYTTTGTENHARVVQDIFLRLLEKGDIYQASMKLPYCTVEKRFLLDRYVEAPAPSAATPMPAATNAIIAATFSIRSTSPTAAASSTAPSLSCETRNISFCASVPTTTASGTGSPRTSNTGGRM